MSDMREPAYYEYIIVESGQPVEEEWKIVGVYGGMYFKWMVFRRYIGNTPEGILKREEDKV